MHDLTGKSALITGASRGIGAAAARVMARYGASVLLCARSLGEIETIAREIADAGGQALARRCDVAEYAQVAAAVELCIAEFGRLDLLVNNAAVIEPIASLAESDPVGWGHALDINVKGVYHGMRAALPAMGAGGGVIVNISSGAATSALEGWSHYSASKAAVAALTRTGKTECSRNGIRVVGLSPGTVATGMQVQIKASGINPISRLDPSVHIPAEWVGEAIAWLCTEDAAEFQGVDISLRDEAIRHRVGLLG